MSTKSFKIVPECLNSPAIALKEVFHNPAKLLSYHVCVAQAANRGRDDMTIEQERELAVRFLTNLGAGGVEAEHYADDLTAWSYLSGLMTRADYLPKLEIVKQIFVDPLTFTIDVTTSEPGRTAVQARSRGKLFTGAEYTNDYHFLIEFNDRGQIRHIREYFDVGRAREALVPAMQQWNARQPAA